MKIAVVTGASSGMGREFVRQLAQREDIEKIWAIARREERLNAMREEISDKIVPVALDLGKAEGRQAYREKLAEEKPHIVCMVNNAGFGKYGTYSDLTEKEIDDMIDVNDRATVHMANASLPYMQKGDKVILLGSSSAFQPLPYFNLYAATKAFVLHFGRALNMELKDRGISVTTVCPGFVDTEFFQVAQQTANPNTCTNFKPMYRCEDVVKKALRDAKKGKDISVLGWNVNMKRLGAKLLPAGLVMRAWLRIK